VDYGSGGAFDALSGLSLWLGFLACILAWCVSAEVAAQPPTAPQPQAPADEGAVAKAISTRLADLAALRNQALDYWRQLAKRRLDIIRCANNPLEWEPEANHSPESEPESGLSPKSAYFVVTINDKGRKDDDQFFIGVWSLIRVELYDDDNVVGGKAYFVLSQKPATAGGTGEVRFVDRDGKPIDPNKPRKVLRGVPNEEVYAEGIEFGHVTITAEQPPE
jgi:hypothetical protein